jgi:hypothetical protein
MGDVVRFPKPDPERDQARLIQKARALYESVFPTDNRPGTARKDTPTQISGLIHIPKHRVR